MTNRIEQFDEQGYVILEDFLEPEIIQQARDEIDLLVDREAEKLIAAGKISDPLTDESFETRLARLYEACSNEAPHIFRRELHLAGLFDVFFETVASIQSFSGVDDGHLPMYLGEKTITWRTSPCPAPVNTLRT